MPGMESWGGVMASSGSGTMVNLSLSLSLSLSVFRTSDEKLELPNIDELYR